MTEKSIPQQTTNTFSPLSPIEISTAVHITDKTIAFVGPAYDCCVDKVAREFVPFFENDGYQITFTLQRSLSEVVQLAPRVVVLVRMGADDEFKAHIGLASISNMITNLQRFGVRVIYYIDDYLLYFNNSAPIEIANMCDAVIVTTDALRDSLLQTEGFNKPVIKIQTHVDIPAIDSAKPLDHIKSVPRLKVLLSSSGRLGVNGLYDIFELANSKADEFDDVQWIINAASVAQFRTIVNQFRHLHKLYLDWLPIQQYYRLLKSVDVMILPASTFDLAYFVPDGLQETWLSSKSALKYALSGAARVPIIAQPIAEYKKAIKHGETGFLAESAQEFLDIITKLKDNEFRLTIGNNARADVEQNYDVSVRYPAYRDALLGI